MLLSLFGLCFAELVLYDAIALAVRSRSLFQFKGLNQVLQKWHWQVGVDMRGLAQSDSNNACVDESRVDMK